MPINKQRGDDSGRAFDELGEGNELRVLWSGGTVTRFELYGSRAALGKIAECAGKMSRLVKKRDAPQRKPQVASYRYEVVPRDQALQHVANIFSKAGVAGYRFLTPKPANTNKHVVYYSLPNGSLGWFSALRGNTPSADDHAAHEFARRNKICDGSFGGEIRKLPSTDGSVIRQLVAACRGGKKQAAVEITIIRHPNGMLLNMGTRTIPKPHLRPDRTPRTTNKQRMRMLDAALRVTE
ncbi:MAG: hypothetical protein JXQ99_16325 [Hyphomicrobiaceae bacterium]